MDTRTKPIRQDIDSIRDSMTDKMEQIEAKIKGTVDDTTETLKRSLDVKLQVQEHPWAALGIAVLAGYALGSMGDSDPSTSSTYRTDFRVPTEYPQWTDRRIEHPSQLSHQQFHNKQYSQTKGFLDDVVDELRVELDTLKTATISSLVGMVRDTVKQNLPGVYGESEGS